MKLNKRELAFITLMLVISVLITYTKCLQIILYDFFYDFLFTSTIKRIGFIILLTGVLAAFFRTSIPGLQGFLKKGDPKKDDVDQTTNIS